MLLKTCTVCTNDWEYAKNTDEQCKHFFGFNCTCTRYVTVAESAKIDEKTGFQTQPVWKTAQGGDQMG